MDHSSLNLKAGKESALEDNEFQLKKKKKNKGKQLLSPRSDLIEIAFQTQSFDGIFFS